MDSQLLKVLVDPISGGVLELLDAAGVDGEVERGRLASNNGLTYEIRGGIPRFTGTEDDDQDQTALSFGFKWAQRATYESDAMARRGRTWLLERYGFSDPAEMRAFFEAHPRTMDLGCGSGYQLIPVDGR